MTDQIQPYVFRDGTVYGKQTPARAGGRAGTPRGRVTGASLAARARLGAARRAADPTWTSKSPEVRRMLIDLDLREGR